MNRHHKRLLYLHIGMPKTGTSALQRFFKLNSNQLKKQGVIYPETGQYEDYSHHGIPFSLAKNTYKKPLSKAQQVAFLGELHEEIKDHPRVLLSSECFPMLGQHRLFFEFACQYETKIICYLRRQDQFIESHYKQVIADPALPDLHYKIDKHITQLNSMMTYSPFIANWTRLGTLIIHPYEKDSFIGGNIFSDFGDAIDITIDETFVFPDEDVNPTDSNAFVDFLRILKSYRMLDEVLKIVSIDGLRTLVSNSISNENSGSFLSRQQRLDILEKFADSNKKVAQSYLGRDELFGDLDMKDYEQLTYDGLSEQEVFFLLSKIVDKASVERPFSGTWEYHEGMSENELFDDFSRILNIDTPLDNPKRNIFTAAKSLLNRFSATKGN